MALNEVIKSSFYRVWDATNSRWTRYSFFTKAADVYCTDSSTVEQKIGSFKGVTDSMSAPEAGYALDATVVSKMKAISVTLSASNWAEDTETGVYHQTVAASGVSATDNLTAPQALPSENKLSGETDEEAYNNTMDALSLINGGVTSSGAITFYCYSSYPQRTLNLKLWRIL